MREGTLEQRSVGAVELGQLGGGDLLVFSFDVCVYMCMGGGEVLSVVRLGLSS